MMSSDSIDRLHTECGMLLELLGEAKNISLLSTANDTFRKTILLSAASFFERRLQKDVLKFAEESTSTEHLLVWLVKNKAIDRQYHTWFDWNSQNVNKFFSLFGSGFKESAAAQVQADEPLASAVRAFLEIGRERNRLVHEDYASCVLEKTADEIYDLYRSAVQFVNWFPEELRRYSARTEQNGAKSRSPA